MRKVYRLVAAANEMKVEGLQVMPSDAGTYICTKWQMCKLNH